MTFLTTTAAELAKLRTLPAIVGTMVATIAAAIALGAAIAASSSGAISTGAISTVDVMVATIPFLQIGVILIAVLAVASEYAGKQIGTTLAATPNRMRLLAAKTLAYLVAAAVTSALAVVAGAVAAAVTLSSRTAVIAGDITPVDDAALWPLVGATGYLVLIGLLAFALAVLLRSLIPPLVTMLSLVLVVSPLVGGLVEHARWLPDRAGSLLYLADTDPVLSSGTGALVLVGWVVVTATAASAAFVARDA